MVALAATGHDRQLAYHVRGAVRCGASAPEIMELMDLIATLIPESQAARAREIAGRFAR